MRDAGRLRGRTLGRGMALVLSCASVVIAVGCERTDNRAVRVESVSEGQLAIDSLLAAGDSLYPAAPDSAGQLWAEALRLAESAQDSARIARATTGLGQAAYRRGAFDTARVLGEHALALKQRLRMSDELFRSYNSLGLIAWRQERLADAVPLMEQAMGAARARGDSLSVAKVMLNQGLVLRDYAQFAQARATLVDARDRLLVEGDSLTYARALNNLASLDIEMGDPQSALVQLAAARRLFAATRDNAGELNARGQLATAYSALGDARRAFSALDSAITLGDQLLDRSDVAENLRIRADMFLEAGDPQHALDDYEKAAAINDSLGQVDARATIMRNQARARRAAGNAGVAYRSAREALTLHERGGFPYSAMKDQLLLAELAQELGRPADAQEHLRSARAAATTMGIPVASGQVALVAAQLAAARSQWAAVLRELDAGAASIGLIGGDAVATRYALRARANARLGNSTRAIADGRAAVEAIERVRGGYDSGELRTRYISAKSSAYADLTLTLLEAKRDSEAFAVADAARGRAMLEHLSSASASLRRDAGTRTLSEADQLLRRIDALMARLRAREESTPRDRSPEAVAMTRGLQDSLRQARSDFEALRSRSVDSSSSAARMISPPLASIRLTQASLVAGELALEYFATDQRLLIFVVSPTAYRVIDQPVPADSLGSRVYLARALMGKRGSDVDARPVLSALHGALIAPVVASGMMKGVRTLVVIPHGLLSYLPFGALVDPATNRFLVEDVAVMVAPSAAVLTAIRSTANADRSAAPRAAALHALAPFPADLPGSMAELGGMKQSIPTLREVVGGAATERALRGVMENEAILHLATHAVMNTRNPLFSRIELAAGDGKTTGDDDKLEVHEILGLDVRSPLVFLSGCETAVGSDWMTRFEQREDYTSIAQAWLAAGAKNVVATLWRIDDAAAAEFTSRFYRALGTSSVPEALAIAQRAMIKDSGLRRPYLWAAYQAIGDGRSPLSFAVGASSEIRAAKPSKLSVSP